MLTCMGLASARLVQGLNATCRMLPKVPDCVLSLILCTLITCHATSCPAVNTRLYQAWVQAVAQQLQRQQTTSSLFHQAAPPTSQPLQVCCWPHANYTARFYPKPVCTSPLAAAEARLCSFMSDLAATLFPAGMGAVGRSASFTGASRVGINPPGRLQAGPDAQGTVAASQAQQQQALFREAAPQYNPGSPLAGQLQINTGGARPCSPTMPNTPGPYGPPGMSRKPIWEA